MDFKQAFWYLPVQIARLRAGQSYSFAFIQLDFGEQQPKERVYTCRYLSATTTLIRLSAL